VVERGGDAGLVEEPVHHRRVLAEVGQEPLHRHQAPRPRALPHARQEDLGHAPEVDAVEQEVASEGGGLAHPGFRRL
jgi:hypothetical protein